MSLAVGARLGPYEVTAVLGAGGMGEVYKARDTRLDRTVALKVLHETLALDPQFSERFAREAKAISSLNHPHICALYDIGEQEVASGQRVRYLVMEYLEGETLAARLERGALPLDEALGRATDVAEALDKAHRAGIVHRDLKPGNVMLTGHGAKLVDFGLAKAATAVSPGSAISVLPTTPPGLTVQGSILGTFQYMAPEQLDGAEADFRSDIFAFGAVLYEMLTGRKAFQAKSHASLIAGIMSGNPPPVSTVEPRVPTTLERVVTTCLAKDPDARWQSAGDLARELKWIAGGSHVAGQPPIERSTRSSRVTMALVGVAAAVLGGALVLGARLMRSESSVDAPAYHVNIELSSGTELRNVSRTLELSPDGRHLLFTAIDASGTTRLWVRRLRDLTATPLEGTESAGMPFWSADGRSVGFFSMQDGMIKRADLAGGPAVNVSRFVFPGGGTWNRDGVILVGGGPEGITQVAAGAALVSVTRVDESRGEVRHHSPRFLPDGRHFLFFASGRRDGDVVNATAANGVYVATLGTNNQKLLIPEAGYAEYASGHLLFMRGQTLMTQPFDVDRLDLTGEARALVDDVQVGGPTASPGGAGGVFSVSANGSLVYRRGSITQLSQLKWFDRSGRPEDTLGEAADHYGLELSPDGKRVAVVTADASGAMDVSVQQIGGTRSRLTFDEVRKSAPVWSPDGQRLVFRAGDLAGDRSELRIKDATGGAEEVLLKDIRGAPSSWSPDGRFILFMEGSPGPAAREPIGGRRDDLFLLPFTPRGAPVRFAQTPLREYVGRISPDGRWVVYSAGRDATRTDVYVSTFPAFGGPWQVSTNGGIDPRWRGDGGEIYYLSSPVGKMMAAEVNGRGTTFQVVTRQELFDLPRIPNYFAWSGYAVSPDGKRFLINQRVDSLTSGVVLVVNWPGLLKD